MYFLDREEVEPLSKFYKLLAGIFFLCACFALASTFVVLMTEPFNWRIIWFFVPMIIGAHTSWCLVYSGYAPRYLLIADASKSQEK